MGRGRRLGQFSKWQMVQYSSSSATIPKKNNIQAPAPDELVTDATNQQTAWIRVSRRCGVGTSTSMVGYHGSRYCVLESR